MAVEELSPKALRAQCTLRELGCDSTDQLQPFQDIIGQERAIRALDFGLGIDAEGFNVYVAGAPGTGRTTAVKGFLDQLAEGQDVPQDWCYVNNFRDQYRPQSLGLPPGWGRKLAREVREFIATVRREIPRAFESEDYSRRREETLESYGERRKEIFNEVTRRAQEEGMVIQNTQIGLVIIPVKDGQPLRDQDMLSLPEEERRAIEEKRDRLGKELQAALKEMKTLEKQASEAVEQLDQEVAQFVIGHLFSNLLEEYQQLPQVVSYLQEMRQDILDNIGQFRQQEQDQSGQRMPEWTRDVPFRKYEVNAIVDNADLEGAPVIIELNPTHNNLFGRMEKEAQFGALVTDFTMIRGGSLHRANGGYIVIPLEELARALFSWDGLKRALKNREIFLEEPGERLGFYAAKSLRPESIPLQIKVVLIGESHIYRLLYFLDQDFRELFKVKAEFDTSMERTDENVHNYATFLCTLCKKEGLQHLDQGALAKIVEFSCRLSAHQGKLSTRFAEIADVIREANHYSRREKNGHVTDRHVKMAIDERLFRSNLIEEKIQEMIHNGQLLISSSGEVQGQVNGLAVLGLGDITFGKPSRITATVGAGREGIVDIEREAKLGGAIHTKGVLILNGFLNCRFGKKVPLSLSARLVFEQNYEGVDGDSASSTELYALLSALSGLPLRQDVAVTGSVNQNGEVQAIGGVNEKIEGFFAVCRQQGLTGQQGVLIPRSNVQNLMLREEVVEAVRSGQFHVWPVDTVDQGIEILTGVAAGEEQPDGTFPEGSVNARVARRLQELAETTREWGDEDREDQKPDEAGTPDEGELPEQD